MTTWWRRLRHWGGRRSRWRARHNVTPKREYQNPRSDGMSRMRWIGLMVTGLFVTRAATAQTWVPAKCDIKPGHYLVTGGMLYLKNAVETRFDDQRQKDLKD